MVDRAAVIFGNKIDDRVYAKACKSKANYAKKFAHNPNAACHLALADVPAVGEMFGLKQLVK